MDILERLKIVEDAECEVALSMDMRPEDTANYHYAETCRHAAREIERLRSNLKNIATQKTTEELKAEGEQEYEDADFEGAYDALIHIARRSIQPTT